MKKAFTLVELLIVMVIVSILIGLSVWGIGQIQRSARDDARKNNLRQMNIAIENFYNQSRKLPTCLSGTSCNFGDLLQTNKEAFASFSIDPKPDKDFSNYIYTKGTKPNTYYIVVNNLEGTSSDCKKSYAFGGISNVDYKSTSTLNLPDKCWGN